MRILQIAPVEEPVPPKKYGGTELVVYNLTEELVKNGHEVFLAATGDSQTSAELIPVFPKSLREYSDAQTLRARDIFKFTAVEMLIKAVEYVKPDIVHNHFAWRLLLFSDFIKCPMVTTLHSALRGSENIVYKINRRQNYVSISNSQRKPLPDLNYAATVYNGIDLRQFDFSKDRGEYAAFLGRMSPEKGPLQAIKAARLAGVKLKMAAKVDISDQAFFDKEIAPQIDGKQVEFLGEIGPEQKNNLLKNAFALLAPIQWEEPFGLYFVEAMACGTPVIAFERGSVPEILTLKTGFACEPDNIQALAEAIKNVINMPLDTYSRLRSSCRADVEERFSSAKMADGYEQVYKKILGK